MESEKLVKDIVSKRISGEIVLSSNPGRTIKKWRNIFQISQRELADRLNIMPSVISDYESGRRKSPGVNFIKKLINVLLKIDEGKGGEIIKNFSEFPSSTILSDCVIDLKEFLASTTISEFCKKINSELIVGEDKKNNSLYGYSVIDSLKAIIELPPIDLVKLYGLTTQRALIFTQLTKGRSPVVAIKVTNLKPGLVVLHGIDKVDDLAKRICEVEGIPLAICRMDVKEMIEKLRNEFE